MPRGKARGIPGREKKPESISKKNQGQVRIPSIQVRIPSIQVRIPSIQVRIPSISMNSTNMRNIETVETTYSIK